MYIKSQLNYKFKFDIMYDFFLYFANSTEPIKILIIFLDY